MKPLQFLSVLLLSAAVAFGTVHFSGAPQTASAPQKETRWEQIKKRGTLRCGYFVWPPVEVRDPNTGEMSGAIVSVTEEMAKQMGLKVEWTEEIDFAHMFSGYDRYDMICGPITQNGMRARETAFTMPLAYGGMYLFSREGDTRFDKDPSLVNDPDVRVSTVDGEYSSIIIAEDFPKAQKVSVGQLGSGTQILLQVATGKADIAITDLFSAQAFMDNNPGKIRLVSDKPVRTLSFSFTLPADAYQLRDAANAALLNLDEIGFLDRAYKQNERGIARLLRLAKPYQED